MKKLLIFLAVVLVSGCAYQPVRQDGMDLPKKPNYEETEGAQTGLPTWSAGSRFTSAQGNTIDDFLEDHETRLDTIEALTGPVFSDGDGTYTDMSAISSTELGYLNGVTSAIQTQLNSKFDATGDLDPDQLTGDSTDNNLVDGDILSPPSTSGVVVDDSGDGNPATGSASPTASLMFQSYSVTCNDADGCTMTMSEVPASDRMVVRVFNDEASLGDCSFSTSAGVQVVRTARTLEAGESILFEYRSNYWNEVAESTGAYSGFDGADITIGGCTGSADTVSCTATDVLLDQNTDMGTGTLDLSGKTITYPSGGWYFADEDSSPTLVGQFKYDNTVAGLTDGALEHHNGTEVRYVVDIATLPTITGQSPVYNSSSGKWVPGQRGAVTHATKAAAYTVGTDSPEECYGGVIYVTSAATITACDGLDANMSFTVVTVGAIAVSVDTQADDLMLLDAVALDDGDKATNTSTTGDTIHCSYYSADGWYCWSGSPDGDHWTDGGP